MSNWEKKRLYDAIGEDDSVGEEIRKEILEYAKKIRANRKYTPISIFVVDHKLFFEELSEKYGLEQNDLELAYIFYVFGVYDSTNGLLFKTK